MLEAAVKKAAEEAQAARDEAQAKRNRKKGRGQNGDKSNKANNNELQAAKAEVSAQTCAWALNRLKNIVSLIARLHLLSSLIFPARGWLRY